MRLHLNLWKPPGAAATVELRVDWAAVGVRPADAIISAVAIQGFQPAMRLDGPAAAAPVLTVPGEQGWLLSIDSR